MSEQNYPIGIQSFEKLIQCDFTYVDKTTYVAKLSMINRPCFLSRPRRFGKSLLLSTMEAFFSGKRELFKGLAIDSMDLDWTPSPVFHFDLNSENFHDEKGLEYLLDAYLRNYEQTYGREEMDVTPAQRLRHLIQAAYEKTGRRVVILIDEYDKPLLGLEENHEVFEKNQALLKAFFGNIKSMDRYIRLAFLTGVARFNKVSIFSDVNNLWDISMVPEFADICGWSEDELLANFKPGLELLAKERREAFDTTLSAMRRYYDGYKFARQGRRLYNPYSVLIALTEKYIKPNWYSSGTPTFLAKRVKRFGIDPSALNGQTRTEEELLEAGLGMDNPVPLMFQTGYLTIDSYDPRFREYTLRFPNREVEIGFAKNLLPLYVPESAKINGVFEYRRFVKDLYAGRPQEFMMRLATLLKDIPGRDHCESTYRAITYLLCVLSGADTRAERETYLGRSDMEVLTPDYIYVFEFKFNRSVREAMNQIHERDYAGHFNHEPRPVFLIVANFSENKEHRGLDFDIERLKTNCL